MAAVSWNHVSSDLHGRSFENIRPVLIFVPKLLIKLCEDSLRDFIYRARRNV